MLDSEEYALALADKFYSAALGAESWYVALAAFASATGSQRGEIVAVHKDAVEPVNLVTNTDPELREAFVAARGDDPAFNPRLRAGLRAPVLKSIAENDFITPDEHKVHPHYCGFARPWGIPYICLAPLDRRDGVLVGLAVLRSEREGHISDHERRVFMALAPHIRAAVRMQMSLEGQHAELLRGVFESLSLPAFLCDRIGQVQALTPSAESIVAQGSTLRVKSGQLLCSHDIDSKALSDAIGAAALAETLSQGTPGTVIARSTAATAPPLVLDVLPLPARSLEFSPQAQVLVVPQQAGDAGARRRVVLQLVYKFTAAEVDVAMHLLQGRTADSIASNRGVAIATVRAQIKCILAKVGLNSQLELVAKLAQL